MQASGNGHGARPTSRLRELRITLPHAPAPLGAYVPASRVGSLLFLSGMLPLVEGKLPFAGRFGDQLTVAHGCEAARLAALNALAVATQFLADLDHADGIARLAVSMVTAPGFTTHAAIADGASELFNEVFGRVPGHARLVSGVHSLPLGSPLSIEVILRLREPGAR